MGILWDDGLKNKFGESVAWKCSVRMKEKKFREAFILPSIRLPATFWASYCCLPRFAFSYIPCMTRCRGNGRVNVKGENGLKANIVELLATVTWCLFLDIMRQAVTRHGKGSMCKNELIETTTLMIYSGKGGFWVPWNDKTGYWDETFACRMSMTSLLELLPKALRLRQVISFHVVHEITEDSTNRRDLFIWISK